MVGLGIEIENQETVNSFVIEYVTRLNRHEKSTAFVKALIAALPNAYTTAEIESYITTERTVLESIFFKDGGNGSTISPKINNVKGGFQKLEVQVVQSKDGNYVLFKAFGPGFDNENSAVQSIQFYRKFSPNIKGLWGAAKQVEFVVDEQAASEYVERKNNSSNTTGGGYYHSSPSSMEQ